MKALLILRRIPCNREFARLAIEWASPKQRTQAHRRMRLWALRQDVVAGQKLKRVWSNEP
jgi:hypothetical protein